MTGPARRTIVRWGTLIGLVLIGQSILVAGVFRVLVAHHERAEIHDHLAQECALAAALAPENRQSWIDHTIATDVHRKNFLGLFSADGQRLAGNLDRPPRIEAARTRPVEATVHPTNLPGVKRDQARLKRCVMPEGAVLYAGMDLDEVEAAITTAERAVLMTLPMALITALLFGGFMAWQAARRLDTMRQLAVRVMAGRVEERLPIRGDGADSFDQLCDQINRMLDRIETLLGQLKATGDDIAHELRTPLARLRSAVELRMRSAESPAAFAAVADTVLEEIDQADRMIDALLRIREIENHRRTAAFERLDLAVLARETIDAFSAKAAARPVELIASLAGPVMIRGDRELLFEAIGNLIDNAIKFSPAGSAVLVGTARDAEGRACVFVRDEAGVIDEQELGRLFQRFYRGADTANTAGSGVGLSLVQAVATLHDAEIWFQPVSDDVTKQVVMRFLPDREA